MDSFIGILVPFILGLVSWRYTLIRKRRTELAEEALLAFATAVDAVRTIRSPFIGSNEETSLRREMKIETDKPIPKQNYLIMLRRIEERQGIFSNLRRFQLLCGFHFGPEATNAFNELRDVIHEIRATASVGAMGGPYDVETPDERKHFSSVIYGMSSSDNINSRLDTAQSQLEGVLIPHLKDDAMILPIKLHWRAGIKRIKAWRNPR